MNSGIIIKSKYVKRYLLQMAIDQLIDEYDQMGYEVKTQYPILNGFRADVYAQDEDDKVAIEFVDNNVPEESLSRIKRLAAEGGVRLRFIELSKIKIEQEDDRTKKNQG